MPFKRGKLVFTEELQEHFDPGSETPYFTAKALVIADEDGQFRGSVDTLRISDLIQKTSAIRADGVHLRAAHEDYEARAENLKIYLMQQVMHFPINVISVKGENEISWEFITPEQFKVVPPNLQASPEFQQYLNEQDSYFFLRKEKNEPI